MNYTKLDYALEADICTITQNDPASLNAAGLDMVEELLHALERAGEEARVTILTGSGRGFCSGANLTSSAQNARSEKPDLGKSLDTHYNPLVKAMRSHPHPLITAVNGAAAGVGCSIALMGDFIICGQSAYFLQAFRRIGLVPDGGSTYLLARTIGRVRAMEMALFGEKLPAETALQWGLVNRVVLDEELMSAALTYARQLADGPSEALALIRDLIWRAEDSDFDGQLHAERIAQRTAGRTANFREGVSAFLQKRPAKFNAEK